MNEDPQRPTVDELARDLFAARHGGGPLTSTDLAACEAIARLATVTDASIGAPNPLDAASELVRRAAMRLSRIDRHQVFVLFGWTEDSEGLKLATRWARLAKYVDCAASTWRTEREFPLLTRLAMQVDAIDRENDALVRAVPRVTSPFDSRLRPLWRERSEFYSRCESSVLACSLDLDRALRIRRGEEFSSSYDDFVLTSLYHLTCALLLDELRYVQFGGDWLLANPRDEERAADAYVALTYQLHPFGQREMSRLRLVLRGCADWELELFAREVAAVEADLVTKWDGWIRSCSCKHLDLPSERCAVHDWLAQWPVFSDAIRSHWKLMTDWYVSMTISPTDPQIAPNTGQTF